MLDTLVRRRSRSGMWWLRALTAPGNCIMAIPIINGIPVVHLFEIIDKEDVLRERQDAGYQNPQVRL
jgi:hypothetical protein